MSGSPQIRCLSSSISVNQAKELFKKAQAVCFDVDSTVITEEGIDVLAASKGVGESVAELTKKAMGGTVLFQDALKDRLSIIQPSKQDINECSRRHPFKLTPKISELIHCLHARGTYVYLVSGGFRQMINVQHY
jgi:phosphoserine phosphatase